MSILITHKVITFLLHLGLHISPTLISLKFLPYCQDVCIDCSPDPLLSLIPSEHLVFGLILNLCVWAVTSSFF